MLRRPPGYTRSDTLSPYPTLFQSAGGMAYTISTLLDGGLLHRDLMTVSTGDLTEYAREPMLDGDALAWADAPANSLDETMLRSYDAPFLPDGGMRLVTGNLGRATFKTSAVDPADRKSTRLNSRHSCASRKP